MSSGRGARTHSRNAGLTSLSFQPHSVVIKVEKPTILGATEGAQGAELRSCSITFFASGGADGRSTRSDPQLPSNLASSLSPGAVQVPARHDRLSASFSSGCTRP